MARNILVTRPEPGAGRTAARLRERGFEPMVCPLTEIRPLDSTSPETDFDAVAATSVNALRHAPHVLVAAAAAKPCFAVGARTAEAARESGFADIRDGGGDAARLAALIEKTLPRGASLLYLCGRVRRPDFERGLESAGFSVLPVETYDTAMLSPDPAGLGATSLDAALLYSATASAALMRLIAADGSPWRWAGTRFLCLSERVAQPLKTLDADIRVSREPSEEALLMLLDADR